MSLSIAKIEAMQAKRREEFYANPSLPLTKAEARMFYKAIADYQPENPSERIERDKLRGRLYNYLGRLTAYERKHAQKV